MLLSDLDRCISPEPNSGCWFWTGAIKSDGYGSVHLDGRTQTAHRVVYEFHRGKIPDGLTLDHLCRVRSCVNPAHLEPATMRENTMRGFSPSAVNATRTTCLKGHPFDMVRSGQRSCRTCFREYDRNYKRRKYHEMKLRTPTTAEARGE
jgi:HNH endonuclease